MQDQIEQEQAALEAAQARVEAELAGKRASLAAVLGQGAGTGEAHARELEAGRLSKAIRHLESGLHGLAFGRIDAGDGSAPLRIGRIGVRDENDELLLIDWRAEAARPFYAATLAEPLGLRRRRHLRTEGGRVLGLSDEILDGSALRDDDAVGDGPLTAALTGARTGRMREAASTLQSEQDSIVRSEQRGVLVVEGGPGTGKTIVALHRAAYVLYAFAEVAERGVLVYGPNRRFLDYIGDVLPSLGENDVVLASLPELVGLPVSSTDSDERARVLGTELMGEALATWVAARRPSGVALTLRAGGEDVVVPSRLVDVAARRALASGLGHNRARGLFLEAIVEDAVELLEESLLRSESEAEAELEAHLGISLDRAVARDLDRMSEATAGGGLGGLEVDWERLTEELLEDPAVDAAIDAVWPRLEASEVVLEVLGLAGDEVGTELFGALSAAERALVADRWAGAGEAEGAAAAWSRAELALLDEARALVDGLPEQNYGHVVIDEAQQLTQMEWRAIMRRATSRSLTVVGDLAQAGPTTTIESWEQALEPFVGERFEKHGLSINYRTTQEILDQSAGLLARIAPTQTLSRSLRHGEEPVRVSVSAVDVARAVAERVGRVLAEHPGELVGVVAADARCAELAAVLGETDAVLVPATEARGLEYDSVLVVDPAGIEAAGPAGSRDLYVALTRATQRLMLLDVA